MRFPRQIQNAQDNAKSAKKRVWKDYVESEAVEAVEEKEKKEMDSERKVSYLSQPQQWLILFSSGYPD